MTALDLSRAAARTGRALLVVLGLLLAACGGGGDGGPKPTVTGNGFAPAAGPGDVEGYFPHAVGDRWSIDTVAIEAGAETRGRLSAAVGAPRVVGGVSAVVLSETDDRGAVLEGYYAPSPGGVTYLGNSDASDTITPWLAPYPLLLFPVALGDVATITAAHLPFGTDGYGNPVTLDWTQRIANAAFETVDVPAGSFSALRHETTIEGAVVDEAFGISIPISGSETRWFAPGVGLVKTASAVTVEDQSSTSRAELRGYSVGGVTRGLGDAVTALPGLGNVPMGYPVVGTDGNSLLLVARKFTANDASGVANWVAQRLSPDGTPLGGSTDLGAPVGRVYGGYNAAVASDGTGYLVVHENEDSLALTAVRVSAQGEVVGTPAIVAPTGDSVAAGDPALAFDGDRYLLVYARGNANGLSQIAGLFLSPATGQADGVEFTIGPAPGYPTTPALAFDGTNYLVAWSQSAFAGQGPGLVAARVSKAGSVLDPAGIALCSATGCGGRPAMAWDGARYLVLWSDPRQDGHFKIYGNRLSPAGELLDGDAVTGGWPVTTRPDVEEVAPTLAFFDGEYLAAWLSSSSPGVYEGLFGARISAAGAVLSSGFLMTRAGFQPGPRLTASPDSALLTWFDPSAQSVGAQPIHRFAR